MRLLAVAEHEASLRVERVSTRAQGLLTVSVCKYAVLLRVGGTLAGVPLGGSLALVISQVEQHLLLVSHVMLVSGTASKWSLLR